MPRGRPRLEDEAPAPVSPFTLEEAARRGLWGVYRIRKGLYTFAPPGVVMRQHVWAGWAVDEDSARRACVERGRDDRHPNIAERSERPDYARRPRPRPPLPDHPVDPPGSFRCGHPRTTENTYETDRGSSCLQCRRDRSREAYHNRQGNARGESKEEGL